MLVMEWGLKPEQHARRRSYLGGSDAGAVVAGGEESQRLWALKTGRAKPEDLSGVLRVMMGLFTEQGNRWWYEQRTGRSIERCQEVQRHPTVPYLACTLDGVTTTSAGEFAVWQAKHVGKLGEETELRYVAQGTHEALCVGADWYVLSTFVGNNRWELGEYEVDPLFAADYLAKCHTFWGYVERDEEPPAVEPLPVPKPQRLRIVQLEDAFRDNWPNWAPEMLGHIRTWASTKAAHELHMVTRESIKTLLPEDVGEITRGLFKLKRGRNGIRMSLGKGGDTDE